MTEKNSDKPLKFTWQEQAKIHAACDCDPELPRHDRCTQKMMCCAASVRVWQEILELKTKAGG